MRAAHAQPDVMPGRPRRRSLLLARASGRLDSCLDDAPPGRLGPRGRWIRRRRTTGPTGRHRARSGNRFGYRSPGWGRCRRLHLLLETRGLPETRSGLRRRITADQPVGRGRRGVGIRGGPHAVGPPGSERVARRGEADASDRHALACRTRTFAHTRRAVRLNTALAGARAVALLVRSHAGTDDHGRCARDRQRLSRVVLGGAPMQRRSDAQHDPRAQPQTMRHPTIIAHPGVTDSRPLQSARLPEPTGSFLSTSGVLAEHAPTFRRAEKQEKYCCVCRLSSPDPILKRGCTRRLRAPAHRP